MKQKINFKKGNGMFIFGTLILCVVVAIFCALTQAFLIRVNTVNAQTAADSVSDGTAVYIANNGGDYDDALDKAKELQTLIEVETGVETKDLYLSEELFDDSKIGVSLGVSDDYINTIYYEEEEGETYTAYAKSVTEFTGLNGFNGVLRWLEASMPYAEYSNAPRTTLTEKGFIKYTDCSGMCWLAYQKMGCTAPLWNTNSMATTFFYEIPSSELRPGDCIVKMWPDATTMGHTVMYIGDNKCFEMGGSSRRRGTPMGYCAMPTLAEYGSDIRQGYHCYRIKPIYMPH